MQPYIEVPTWENGQWDITTFFSKEEFRDFVHSLFKEPGKYEFDQTALIFNEEARKFQKQGFYCNAPFRSKDYIAYWDAQKERCRRGVIFKNNGKTWYLTRDYYMWINFLPIYDKEKKKFDFPQVWDSQYHMALYELLAELNYKHVALLKKRQIGSSYFHCSKLINQYWFEQGAVLKMGASIKDYINEKGSWKFLDEYRNFLNEHTAWYRNNQPNKVFAWQQQIEVTENGRKTMKGLKSVITGVTFEKDPTNGVGGAVVYFFHEEAGIAPKMDVTYEFIRPALQMGMVTTGTFIAAGSVGDLDQCEPLKSMILKPEENDIFPVTTNLINDTGVIGKSGLFIPEQWSMPPYIDEYGNSLVEDALKAIYEERVRWKKSLSPEQYQLRISQKPTNIDEAFAARKESIFPIHLINHQLKRIEDGLHPVEYVELFRDSDGKIKQKASSRRPISEYPVDKKMEDKSGVICIWERPDPSAPWGTYYASIDPVAKGVTSQSDSLCAIYIYKVPVEVSKIESDGSITHYTEGDKIVAGWSGRFDDITKTHELLEMLIEYYNSWTVVENNVGMFTLHMIAKRKQKYLVQKDMLLFKKDIDVKPGVKEYGWTNSGNTFKVHMLPYAVESLKEELHSDTDSDGNTIKGSIRYGVERIPDPMLLVEMKEYEHGKNADRLVAYTALMKFVEIQQSNRGIRRKIERVDDKLENSEKMSKLYMTPKNPFKHIGGTGKNAFKNLR